MVPPSSDDGSDDGTIDVDAIVAAPALPAGPAPAQGGAALAALPAGPAPAQGGASPVLVPTPEEFAALLHDVKGDMERALATLASLVEHPSLEHSRFDIEATMNTAQMRLSEMEGYVQHEAAPPEEGRGAILEKMHEETAWVRRLSRAYALLLLAEFSHFGSPAAAAADGGPPGEPSGAPGAAEAAAGPPNRKRQRKE